MTADEAIHLIDTMCRDHPWSEIRVEAVLRILDAVEPADGITLTHDEARQALSWIEVTGPETDPLIAKLEGKS